jgi:hypothetical protein
MNTSDLPMIPIVIYHSHNKLLNYQRVIPD